MRHRVTPEIVDVAALGGFGLNLRRYPAPAPRKLPLSLSYTVPLSVRIFSSLRPNKASSMLCRMPAVSGVPTGRFGDKSACVGSS